MRSVSRRRFLSIAAVAAGAGPLAALGGSATSAPVTRWRGRALGADAEITLRGPAAAAGRAVEAAVGVLRRMERLFSLYAPDSALSRLNRTARLDRPAPEFVDLLRLCQGVHDATGGAFDPSVQPVWALLAAHGASSAPADLAAAESLVDWAAVGFDPRRVGLGRRGMALTFNGVAQGYATDQVARALALEGFADTLVNIGEFRAGQGAWRVAVADPLAGIVETRQIARTALATSSPPALTLSGAQAPRPGVRAPAHILDPKAPLRPAVWSTVSVEARSAAEADAFSTGFALLDLAEVQRSLARTAAVRRVLLIDWTGRRTTLKAS